MTKWQGCLDWILDNKEWLFSGIATNAIFFFLGRQSIQKNIVLKDKSKKIIKGNGINNRAAENYHEDHSVNYNIQEIKSIVKRKIPDLTTAVSLGVRASGYSYIVPYAGLLCSIGLEGTAIINDLIRIALLPNGTQIDVEKGDRVKIIYTQQSVEKRELLFFAKKELINE